MKSDNLVESIDKAIIHICDTITNNQLSHKEEHTELIKALASLVEARAMLN